MYDVLIYDVVPLATVRLIHTLIFDDKCIEAHFLKFLRVQVSNSQTSEGSEAQKTVCSIMTFLGAQAGALRPQVPHIVQGLLHIIVDLE